MTPVDLRSRQFHDREASMKIWVLALVVSLAVPAGGDDKKKPPEKKGGPSVDELLAQADGKQKAGDLDGAVELLRRASGLEGATGEPSLRLGRVLEQKLDLDAAMDAYKAASDKLSGAAKGEALGRLS